MVAALFSAATLIFGIFNWRAAIFRPFLRQGPEVTVKTDAELEQERRNSLKTKDTDQDGLSDFDELYIYRTSPFIEDSDSDDISDRDEIARGSDPNCHEGQTCRQPRTGAAAASGTTGTESPAVAGESAASTPATDQSAAAAAQAIVETFGDITSMTPEAVQAKLNSLSSRELKDFFIKLGFPRDAIEQASDDLLRQSFMETLRETGTPGATAANATSGSATK